MQVVFRFGCPETRVVATPDSVAVELTNTLVAGAAEEFWRAETAPARNHGLLTLWQGDSLTWGAGVYDLSPGKGIETAAYALYDDLLDATRHLTLQRIWNFVPRINSADGALENYQAFCRGRAQAFDAEFGSDSEPRMPAASAVGTGAQQLCVVFVAGGAPVRHVENPRQVPAYRYPARYGPRAPSFARASVVETGTTLLHVSGTASISRSESLHPGNVTAQLQVALDNVDVVARTAGFAEGLNAASPGDRSFRVYLRHPEHWASVQGLLRQRLVRDGDRFSVIQADVCRRELLVEVEAAVRTGHALS